MNLIDVTWSAVLGIDSDAFMVRRECSLMPPWAEIPSNATDVAAKAFRDWASDQTRVMGRTNWDEWYGDDGIYGDAVVIIHEPQNIAGKYEVCCERVIKATARKLTDKEAEHVDMMLAQEKL